MIYNESYNNSFNSCTRSHKRLTLTVTITYNSEYTFFSIVTHFIIAYHISLVNVHTNYCDNSLLIFDIKQLSKIIKLYYFYTLKALCDGQGEIKMYYGMFRVKKYLMGKRSIGILNCD